MIAVWSKLLALGLGLPGVKPLLCLLDGEPAGGEAAQGRKARSERVLVALARLLRTLHLIATTNSTSPPLGLPDGCTEGAGRRQRGDM